jgi:hypothetical protein
MSATPDADALPQQPNDPMHAPLGAGLDLTSPTGPLARYYLRASHVIAALVLALIFVHFAIIPLWHTDIWGHLKYGEWIVHHREFPTSEPLSPFTDKSFPMVHAGWLSQVAYHALFRAGAASAGGDSIRQLAGGVEFLRAEHQLVVFAIYAVMLAAMLRYGGSLPTAIVCLVALYALTVSFAKVQRPQTHGALCFVILLFLLARPISWHVAILGLPLLLALWANLHGSFAIGLALVGLLLAGRAVEVRPFLRGIPSDPQVRRLLVSLLVSTVAISVLNPHGPLLFWHVARFSGYPNVTTAMEWQRMQFTLELGPQWGFVAMCLAIIFLRVLSRRPIPIAHAAWLLVVGVGSVLQQRLMTWWIFVAFCVLAAQLTAVLERLPWRILSWRSQPNFLKTSMVGFPIFLVVAYAPPVQWLVRHGPMPLEQSLFRGTEWKLAQTLKREGEIGILPDLELRLTEAYPQGKYAGPVFCSETKGDYLFWAMPREISPMAYTHFHLFPAEYWTKFLSVLLGQPGWEDFLQRYGANLIVIEPSAHWQLAAAVRASPEWLVVADEAEAGGDPMSRRFIALRRRPISPKEPVIESNPQ